MGFLLFGKSKETKQKRAFARSLHGLPVRYVTERRNGNDDVVSHGGHIAAVGDKILIDGETDTLFEGVIDDTEVSMLLSGNGAIIKGKNARLNGEEHTYTVHFVYHRK